VIDPWGKILLEMSGSEPGFGVVNLDLSQVEGVRGQIPSLKNDRAYKLSYEKS
jgi:predicted amidohydrolase